MVLEQFRLDGCVALVTGCRSGIGRAIAIALAEAGADIIGVSQRLNAGDEVETAVGQRGKAFFRYTCDLGDSAARQAFIQQVRQECPPATILVNNAGIIERAPASEHPDASWDRVMSVNLDAPFVLAREFGRDMLEAGYGKIIFIASLLTFQGGILVPGYAASKGGIGQLTKALSNEWAGRGVNVNAIAPGYIETANTEPLRQDPGRNAAIVGRIPAGRWGRPEDLAGAAVFLASHASDYVHGAILTVDGGWMGR